MATAHVRESEVRPIVSRATYYVHYANRNVTHAKFIQYFVGPPRESQQASRRLGNDLISFRT